MESNYSSDFPVTLQAQSPGSFAEPVKANKERHEGKIHRMPGPNVGYLQGVRKHEPLKIGQGGEREKKDKKQE